MRSMVPRSFLPHIWMGRRTFPENFLRMVAVFAVAVAVAVAVAADVADFDNEHIVAADVVGVLLDDADFDLENCKGAVAD